MSPSTSDPSDSSSSRVPGCTKAVVVDKWEDAWPSPDLVKYTVHLSPIITAIVIPVVQGLNRAMPKVKPRMDSSTPPTDEQQSQEELQRNYVVFLMNVVQSKLHPYLWDEKIAPNLMDIMNALVQASVDVPNAAVGKCSFFVMENLLKLWVPVQGDKIMNTAGVTSLATDVSIFSLSQENQAAFVNFSVTKMVPKHYCWKHRN